MKRVLCTLALLLAVAVLPGVARAGDDRAPAVVPPTSPAARAAYELLSVRWWQWVLSVPAAHSPLLDQSGADCAAGQAGPVWFLAGSLVGEVHRVCTVPAGKAIYFPLVNIVDVNTADQTADQLRQEIGGFVAGTRDLRASVDGVAVRGLEDPATSPFRTPSPDFALTLPAGNLFGLPAGTYRPAVADGYYVLLAPLAPGEHTISFGGVNTAACCATVQDVTYRVTVAR